MESEMKSTENLVPRAIPEQLQVDLHVGREMDYPRTVYYQTYQPQSHSSQATSWYVEAPGQGYLLDSFAHVNYRIRVRRPGAAAATDLRACFVQTGQDGLGSTDAQKPALRQNFPVTRSIRNATLTINQQNISVRPFEYVDAMNRCFLNHEESKTYATISSGYYDCGNYSNFSKDFAVPSIPAIAAGGGAVVARPLVDGFGVNPAANQTVSPAFTIADYNTNHGFARRLARFFSQGRKQANNGTDLADNASTTANKFGLPGGGATDGYVEFNLSEPVCVSPFSFYPSLSLEGSIPNVTKFTLEYTYVSNFSTSMLQAYIGAGAADFEVTIAEDPVLHLRWYRPPYIIPPAVPIKHVHIQGFQDQFQGVIPVVAGTASVDKIIYNGAASSTTSFNNIRLPSMPDLFLIYIKAKADDATFVTPSDHNLAITKLQLSLDGVSGRVLNASSQQLYRMWLTNAPAGTKSEFDEWLRYHCVVALTPTDLGVADSDLVSQKRPLNMNIDQIDYVNFWLHARTGSEAITADMGASVDQRGVGARAYLTYVQCIWRDKKLTLMSNGQASLKLA